MRFLLRVVFGALLLAVSMGCSAADSDRVAKCEADWARVTGATEPNAQPIDKSSVLQSWLALEPSCRGTGVFEYRLATLYLVLGRPDSAIPLLAKTDSWPGDYPKMAPFVRLNAQMQIYAAQTPFPQDKFKALKPEFLAALARASDSAIANEQTSRYLALTGDYADAVKYATRSLEIDHKKWEASRTLTIAHTGLGQFNESIASGARTLQLNSDAAKDPYFMYALAKAYSGTGDLDTAQKVLAALLSKVPSVRGTDDWKNTIEFMREQVLARGQAK